MGIINPAKVPKRKQRRDDTSFDEYAEGGLVPESPGSLAGEYSTALDTDLETAKKKAQTRKRVQTVRDIESEQQLRKRLRSYAEGGTSKVNEAGNYTKPGMRKALFNRIKASATQGTAAGQWSARKAQLLAKQYKAKGGGYRD
jgi:hypothetical protein